MNIPKATELLETTPYICTSIGAFDFKDAIRLGFEGLEAIEAWRIDGKDEILLHLPSETEE